MFGRPWSCPQLLLTAILENDIVLLKRRGNDEAKPILTKRLRPVGKIETHRGTIDQASLIGKEIRDVVYTNKGVGYRIHQPTLAEYVTLSPRMVTPVRTSIHHLGAWDLC
jgi:tRNA (adenine57-N1/adenine58-N1)-methyltransferase